MSQRPRPGDRARLPQEIRPVRRRRPASELTEAQVLRLYEVACAIRKRGLRMEGTINVGEMEIELRRHIERRRRHGILLWEYECVMDFARRTMPDVALWQLVHDVTEKP